MKALEQMDVLGFLTGEIEDRAHAPVVAEQMRPRMIEQERQNEFFDDPEDAEILVRADLVEDALLEGIEASSTAVRARLSGIKFRAKSSS